MTGTLPPAHAAFLERTVEILKLDDRFDALLVGGSMVHGGFDDLSDLDLVLIVRDRAYSEVLEQRRALASGFGDLLAAFTGEHVSEPRLLICLYGRELLHVDLKFLVLSDLMELVERPLVLWAREPATVEAMLNSASIVWPERSPDWFEQRAWIWLHYGATKLLRGELFEAMAMIAFFKEQVLGPLLSRRYGRPQRGLRKIELIGGEEVEKLRTVVAGHSGEAISSALRNALELYVELRRDDPPIMATPGMPDLLMPLLGAGVTADPQQIVRSWSDPSAT